MKMRTEYTCPLELVHDMIKGKWKPIILWRLRLGATSLAKLERDIDGITQKMLLEQGFLLNELYREMDGHILDQFTYKGYMKISCLKVGGRTIKTVVAVFLCLLTGIIRKSDTAFYAAIAAMLCIQRTAEDSFREAFNREVATVIGGIWGMLVLLFERNVWCSPYEVLRCLLLSVLLIPIINFSILIKREKGTFLMCVVFLCITVTHGNDVSPLSFGIARILDTTIGIVIALIINQFPICKTTGRCIWNKGKRREMWLWKIVISRYNQIPLFCRNNRECRNRN